jgi:hypothetical protein
VQILKGKQYIRAAKLEHHLHPKAQFRFQIGQGTPLLLPPQECRARICPQGPHRILRSRKVLVLLPETRRLLGTSHIHNLDKRMRMPSFLTRRCRYCFPTLGIIMNELSLVPLNSRFSLQLKLIYSPLTTTCKAEDGGFSPSFDFNSSFQSVLLFFNLLNMKSPFQTSFPSLNKNRGQDWCCPPHLAPAPPHPIHLHLNPTRNKFPTFQLSTTSQIISQSKLSTIRPSFSYCSSL